MGRFSFLPLAGRGKAARRLLSSAERAAPKKLPGTGRKFLALHSANGSAAAEAVLTNRLVGNCLSLCGPRQPDQEAQLKGARLRSHAHNYRSRYRRSEVRAKRRPLPERTQQHAESADQAHLRSGVKNISHAKPQRRKEKPFFFAHESLRGFVAFETRQRFAPLRLCVRNIWALNVADDFLAWH